MKNTIDEAIKILTGQKEFSDADKARVAIELDKINAQLAENQRMNRNVMSSHRNSLARIASIAMLAADELRLDNDRAEFCRSCGRPEGEVHQPLCIFNNQEHSHAL